MKQTDIVTSSDAPNLTFGNENVHGMNKTPCSMVNWYGINKSTNNSFVRIAKS